MNSKKKDLFSDTDIFKEQHPGTHAVGPRTYTGLRDKCYCCNRSSRSNYWSILNPPSIDYIGVLPGSTLIYYIPFCCVLMCPDCVGSNRNVIAKCKGCNCVMVPDATYKIGPDLAIYCEYCYNSAMPDFFREKSFLVHVYDILSADLTFAETIAMWRNLRKIPLEKENPFIKSLQSH